MIMASYWISKEVITIFNVLKQISKQTNKQITTIREKIKIGFGSGSMSE